MQKKAHDFRVKEQGSSAGVQNARGRSTSQQLVALLPEPRFALRKYPHERAESLASCQLQCVLRDQDRTFLITAEVDRQEQRQRESSWNAFSTISLERFLVMQSKKTSMGCLFRRPRLNKGHVVGLQNSTLLAVVQKLAAKSLALIPSYEPWGWKQCAHELVRMSRTLECEAFC